MIAHLHIQVGDLAHLPVASRGSPFLGQRSGNDFWLFDDRLARVHHFDGDGAVVDDEFIEDQALIKHLAAACEAVWERAVPHDQYSI